MPHLFCHVSVMLAVAAVTASAQTTAPKWTEIPLVDCDGLLCVDAVTGTGQPLKLLLDLGARNPYLDTKAAQRLGLAPAAGSNNSPVQQTIVPGLHLAGLLMGDFPFMVLDTSPAASTDLQKVKAKRIPADGALTYGAFQNRILQLDIAHHVVRLTDPLAEPLPCPSTCSDIELKHFGRFGPVTLTVHGFAVNNKPVDAQVDTLFTGTILLYPNAVASLGLKKLAKTKHKEPFPYTQDGLQLTRAQGVSLSFRNIPLMEDAPAYFWGEKNEAPSATQFDATVGTALLSRAVVNFDFKSNRFWLQPAN